MARARVHNLFVSLDGIAAGDHITLEHPIGDAGALFAGFDGRCIHGIDRVDAPMSLDRMLTSTWGQGIGAEIMGRGKFGPQTGPWTDEDWRGWWGEEPPFETPVIVLTHHEREPLAFDNGTVVHFLNADPAEALRAATEMAGGLDVRIGGGPTMVREFLAADLIDAMHVVIRPVVLGRGVRLWEGLEGIQERFAIETVASTDGAVHQLWNRLPRS